MVGEGGVEAVVPGHVDACTAGEQQVDERSGHAGIARRLARQQEPHGVAAVRAQGPGACVGSGGDDDPRELHDVRRQRPIARRITGDEMQQRRAGEVPIRWVEIRSRPRQRRIRAQQLAQACGIARVERGERLLEPRMRRDRCDPCAHLHAGA